MNGAQLIGAYISERKAENLTPALVETLVSPLFNALKNETSAEVWTEAINLFMDDMEANGRDHQLTLEIEPAVSAMEPGQELDLSSQPVFGKLFRDALMRLHRTRGLRY